MERLMEGDSYINNIYKIDEQKLNKGKTKNDPWSGSYWGLVQGQIANPYQERSWYNLVETFSWTENFEDWQDREKKFLPNVMNLDEKALAKLAPSEKYDLLMGDTSFDLTKRLWNFIGKWGNGEAWSFISSIDVPHGYHRPKPDTAMAMWEGICHGWAVAAGHYPRPEKTVEVKLPNGKKLPFYPDDIKALASLMFANSLLQDEVIMEGLRCWDKGPKRDTHGRVVDRMPEKSSDGVLPRCADVHPAIWHMSIINLTGVQGRSFIAEIDFNAKVNNHPVQGYEIEYYNPNSGFTSRTLKGAMEAVNGKYFNDSYYESRHPDATHIVGIDMKLALTDWSSPKPRATDSPKNDGILKRHMLYDLELDKDGNIIGGQWRVERRIPRDAAQSPNGKGIRPMPRTNQPDFFWVIPKDYMKHFASTPALPRWNVNEGVLVPKEWKNEAITAHSFVYQVTREFGFNEQCMVYSDDNDTPLEIPCEYKYPKPQPLVDVVNQLMELSRK